MSHYYSSLAYRRERCTCVEDVSCNHRGMHLGETWIQRVFRVWPKAAANTLNYSFNYHLIIKGCPLNIKSKANMDKISLKYADFSEKMGFVRISSC